MVKWEYLTQSVTVAPLYDLGQQGWRLVSVWDGIMFFERPVVETDAGDPVATEATAESPFFGRKIVPVEPVKTAEPPPPVVTPPPAETVAVA